MVRNICVNIGIALSFSTLFFPYSLGQEVPFLQTKWRKLPRNSLNTHTKNCSPGGSGRGIGVCTHLQGAPAVSWLQLFLRKNRDAPWAAWAPSPDSSEALRFPVVLVLMQRWPNLSFPVTTWQRDLPTTGRRKGQSQDPGATPQPPPPPKPLSSPGSCLKSEWGLGRSTFWRRWIMDDSSLDWTGSLMSGIRMIIRLRVAGKVPESIWDISMMGKDSGIQGLKVNVEIHIFILSYASLSPLGFNCFSNIFISLI